MAFINDGAPFLTSEAGAFGYRRADLELAINAAQLRRIFRGVLVDGAVPDSRDLRLEAARLVLPPHAVVSDHSAAWLYGVDTVPPGMRRDLRLMCVVPHSRHRISNSRVIVRQIVRPDADAVEIRGVCVTSPVRTTADLLRRNHRPYALAAGDAMIRAHVADSMSTQEYVNRLRRVPYLKQAMELAPRLTAASESHGESWTRCRILDAGLPEPDAPTCCRPARRPGSAARCRLPRAEGRIGV